MQSYIEGKFADSYKNYTGGMAIWYEKWISGLWVRGCDDVHIRT